MTHKHYVQDNDTHFIVCPITRTIRPEKSFPLTLIQNDHHSERITFEIPRYIDGHDMSDVTRAEIHYLNLENGTENHQTGCYIADDVQILPNNKRKIRCTWLISRNATKYVGSLHFLLRFICVSEEDTDYVWSTAIYSEIKVAPGFAFAEEVVTANPDILVQWEEKLNTLTSDLRKFQQDVTEITDILLQNNLKTDTTLTVAGAAADAKTTGDRLSELEAYVEELMYQPVTIKNFTNDVGTAEIGSVVDTVTFHWSCNKTPTTVTIDNEAIIPFATTYGKTNLYITENTDFVLTVTDERETSVSKTTSITFLNGVYFGVSKEAATLDSAFILTLTKYLRSTKLPSFTVNAAADEFIYYCVPTRFGDCSFAVDGFTGGFTKTATLAFTNASGYTEDYDIYRSDYHSLGKTTVTVG